MRDRLDCDLQDSEALAEIRLTTELIIAASESAHVLSPHAIDVILGVVAPADEAEDEERLDQVG